MNKRKYILVSSIIIYVLHFIAHFVYDVINIDLIAIFFPTNESIFQHMKMVFSCFFFFYLILFIVRRRFNFHNIFLTNLISSITSIATFLIIYIPTYLRFGENMIFTFILLFIAILFGQYVGSFFLQKENYKYLDFGSIIIILIIFIINAYFTFNPIKSFIFWDPEHETYERVLK